MAAAGIIGRTMRDRQHRDDDRPIACALGREHNYGRTILAPFLLPTLMLVVPQIRIGNNEAGLGVWKCHFRE